MTGINVFPPNSAELEYIAKGRALFQSRFPGQDFDAPAWDITPLRNRQHTRSNPRVYWTRHGSQTEALPARFVAPVKAACVLDLQSATNLVFRVGAARLVWEALRTRVTSDAFVWAGVTVDDMLEAEQKMRGVWAASSTYKSCGSWSRVLELLAGAKIVRPMDVPWVTPRPEDSERYTLDGQDARMAKLPSASALEAVADIYRQHAKTPADRIIACAPAIMNATSLRIGEVLTLPVRCLERSGGLNGRARRWRLRYWIEKNDDRVLEALELTETQGRLVAAAVKRIRRITRSARRRALVLERRPGAAPLPGVGDRTVLTPDEVVKVFGYKERSSLYANKDIPRRTHISLKPGRKEYFYEAADLQAYLLRRQGPLWTVQGRNGQTQTLSESLFVVHALFLHSLKATLRLLVEPVTEQQVNDFLGGRYAKAQEGTEGVWMRPVVQSAFDRFNLREPDGSPIEMTTHMFRHWLVTQLNEKGVPDAVIARWQNRAHAGDLGAYKHLTNSQKACVLKDGIVDGRIRGELADMYFALADDVRDAFLDEQAQHVHVTDLGLCVHDFSVSPCPFHLNCLKGCGDYLHDTSDEVQRRQLVQLTYRTRQVIEAEEKQAELTGEEVSETWLADHKTVVRNAERILASTPAPGTTLVQPFAGEPSLFAAMGAE